MGNWVRNLWHKMTQVETTMKEPLLSKKAEELKNLTQEIFGINGRQFTALCSCVMEEVEAVNNAREQDSAMAVRSIQEKMDQNSKETTTKVSNILKKVEKLETKLMTTDNDNKDDIADLKDDVNYVINDMRELQYEVESQEPDVKTALKSLQDVTNELKSVKYAAMNQEKELRNVKEELRVVKDQTRGAKDEQRELTEAGLRKEVMDANLRREVHDFVGSAQTVHVQKVRQATTELEACREGMFKLVNNKKRNWDSTFKQNKKLRKQSTRGERGTASNSSTFNYSSSSSSSEFDSRASSSESSSSTDLDSSSSNSDSSDSDSLWGPD